MHDVVVQLDCGGQQAQAAGSAALLVANIVTSRFAFSNHAESVLDCTPLVAYSIKQNAALSNDHLLPLVFSIQALMCSMTRSCSWWCQYVAVHRLTVSM